MEPDKWPGDPIPPDFSSNGHILSRLLTLSFGMHSVAGGIPGAGVMAVSKSHRHNSQGTHALVGAGRQGERKLSRKGMTVLGYRWGHNIYQHRVSKTGRSGKSAGRSDISAEFPISSMSKAWGPGGDLCLGTGWAMLDPRESEEGEQMVTGEADRAR